MNERNRYGLYDAPVRSPEPEKIALSREDLGRQLDAGAFLMTYDAAVANGFLDPYEAQDAVFVTVRG